MDKYYQIAAEAHEGQTDNQGQPYIGHVSRVALRAIGIAHEYHITDDADVDKIIAAGLLHDTIEDTDLTAYELLTKGVSKEVVDIVTLLTRQDETYAEFIQRIVDSGNKLAMIVKLADNADNLDPTRGPLPEGMIKRYTKARNKLLEGLQ